MAFSLKHAFQSAVADDGNTALVQPSNWNAEHAIVGELAVVNGGTGGNTAGVASANLMGFTSIATAGTTTTLTAASTPYQIFTGSANQTITLPVVSTLVLSFSFHIVNNATGTLTVNSSGGNLLISIPPGVTAMATCILLTGTTAASWEAGYTDFSTMTGTGNVVMSNSPALVTPNLGTPSAAVLTSATGLPLTTGVTGTLALANGGTGGTTKDTARVGLGITVGTTAPATPAVNDIWVDTN